MWKCSKCGEECEDSFEVCWSCGAGTDGAAPTTTFKSEKGEFTDSKGPGTREAKPRKSTIISRYSDAYAVARGISSFGATVKFLAVILGVGVSLVGIATQSSALAASAIGIGAIAGLGIYVLGSLVSAQAQILVATLDTAVNSSQFLTKEEMRRVMSLS